MTEIRLWNTATKSKEVLRPIDPHNVRMYVCGPTVYDRAHLGNARPAIVFDVLARLLRHVYGPDHVTYVRNITDVDDKINAEAQRRKAAGAPGTLEELIAERAEETIRWYHDDMAALGVLPPDHEPRATGYIAEMIAMIEGLIARGHAYAAEGHVLFRVGSYRDYGALSRRSVDDMIAGARVEVAPYKEDPLDFVLWKPSDGDLPGWDSPWGRGRPGWHIECSAMAQELLGDSFDIHGGGIDLQFPHHENEIAQSRCMGHGFAKIWMHNEMLQVEGKKMSKSLGNFFTVRDLLDQGVPGEVIRFVMLSTHYRSPMDWTEKKREEAETALYNWRSYAARLPSGKLTRVLDEPEIEPRLLELLADDLNTAGARGILSELGKALKDGNASAGRRLNGSLSLLGLDLNKDDIVRRLAAQTETGIARVDLQRLHKDEIGTILERRTAAREAKDFALADRIRDELASAGVKIMDVPDGPPNWEITSSFDPAKLEVLK
jgi:cysteinyl-tRNA synthetase